MGAQTDSQIAASERDRRDQRYMQSMSSNNQQFYAALDSGDQDGMAKAFRVVLFMVDGLIRERSRAESEVDALAAELLLYRPRRDQRPAAPLIAGYCYVSSGSAPWVCTAVERREVVSYHEWSAIGLTQEHYVPERKTLCGAKTAFPISERFTSGGWPRVHELCPRCVVVLVGKGLWPNPT